MAIAWPVLAPRQAATTTTTAPASGLHELSEKAADLRSIIFTASLAVAAVIVAYAMFKMWRDRRSYRITVVDFTDASGVKDFKDVAAGLSELMREQLAVELRGRYATVLEHHDTYRVGPPKGMADTWRPTGKDTQRAREIADSLNAASGKAGGTVRLIMALGRERGSSISCSLQRLGPDAEQLGITCTVTDLKTANETRMTWWYEEPATSTGGSETPTGPPAPAGAAGSVPVTPSLVSAVVGDLLDRAFGHTAAEPVPADGPVGIATAKADGARGGTATDSTDLARRYRALLKPVVAWLATHLVEVRLTELANRKKHKARIAHLFGDVFVGIGDFFGNHAQRRTAAVFYQLAIDKHAQAESFWEAWYQPDLGAGSAYSFWADIDVDPEAKSEHLRLARDQLESGLEKLQARRTEVARDGIPFIGFSRPYELPQLDVAERNALLDHALVQLDLDVDSATTEMKELRTRVKLDEEKTGIFLNNLASWYARRVHVEKDAGKRASWIAESKLCLGFTLARDAQVDHTFRWARAASDKDIRHLFDEDEAAQHTWVSAFRDAWGREARRDPKLAGATGAALAEVVARVIAAADEKTETWKATRTGGKP